MRVHRCPSFLLIFFDFFLYDEDFYLTITQGNKFFVKKYNGSGWDIVGGQSGFTITALENHIRSLGLYVDHNETPWVYTYVNQTEYTPQEVIEIPQMKVIKLEGNLYTELPNATDIKIYTGDWVPQFIVDSQDRPYIAYHKLNQSRTVLKYFENNLWSEIELNEGVAWSVNLALGNNDEVFVFTNTENSQGFQVLKYANGIIEYLPAVLLGSYPYRSHLTVDSDNNPVVTTFIGQQMASPLVYKFLNGEWPLQGEHGFSAGRVFDSELAITADNVFQLYAGRAFYHKTSYEELNFKFTIFLS